jgi:peptide/nickel transport system substrate-binding protein
MRRRAVLAAAAGITAATPLGRLGRPVLAQVAARTAVRPSGCPHIRRPAVEPCDDLLHARVLGLGHAVLAGPQSCPRPQAAERAEVSSDELTWTITLRDGLIFHDNVPVLAPDAVASVKRWSQKDPIGQTIAAITNEIKAIDDKRFQIILKQPFRTMLFSLASRNIFVQPERIAGTPVG